MKNKQIIISKRDHFYSKPLEKIYCKIFGK